MPGRRRFLTGLAGVATLALIAGPAHAADRVTVAVELDRSTTQVGEAVELTIQVERVGEGRGIPDPVLPDFAALGITIAGDPSTFRGFTSMNINGVSQSRITQTYSYTLIPGKPGKFTLPVHVMNGAVKINAIRTPVLEVTGTAVVAAPPVAGSSSDPTEAAGDIFLWTRLDKPRAYVGEQLIYALEVYERLPFPNIQLRALPGFPDFWSEEMPEGEMRTETVAGTPYRVHPGLRRALFPQRAGTLTISAPEVGVLPTTVSLPLSPTAGMSTSSAPLCLTSTPLFSRAAVLRGTDVRAIIAGHLHYATTSSFAGIPVSVAAASCYTVDPLGPGGWVRGQDGGQALNLVHVFADRIVHTAVPIGEFATAYSFAPRST